MSTANTGRPVEVHISPVTSVELDAMPLITTMAYGERHVSKMLNMNNKGIVAPGIYKGFIPEVIGGLDLAVRVDPELGFSVAAVDIGMMQLRVFQQHDVSLQLLPNAVNVVVIEAFYQEGVVTSQVSDSSYTLPARIRRLPAEQVTDEHVIICTIDLVGEENNIPVESISLDDRAGGGTDVASHISDVNAHPQYVKATEANELIDDTVTEILDTKVTDDYTGSSSTLIASQKALKDGMNDRALKNHTHDVSSLPEASTESKGVVLLSDSYQGTSSDRAVTEKALKDGLDNQTVGNHTHPASELPEGTVSEKGVVQLSNNYNGTSTSIAVTERALKDGLDSKAPETHSHSVSELPEGTAFAKGIVQLSNSYTGTSQTKAVTEKALKDGLSGKASETHSHPASQLPDATVSAQGVVQLSNSYTGTSQSKATTEKALKDGLAGKATTAEVNSKADNLDIITVSANITISRTSSRMFLDRTGTNDLHITINGNTFQEGDSLEINNYDVDCGITTVTNADGMITSPYSEAASTHTISGKCRVLMIKKGSDPTLSVM